MARELAEFAAAYLMGNHTIAERMCRHDPAVMGIELDRTLTALLDALDVPASEPDDPA